jgi:hypothetical protein
MRESSTAANIGSCARVILLLFTLFLAWQVPAQDTTKTAGAGKSTAVINVLATREGDRVRFYLPPAWTSRYWKNDPTLKAYIAQLPPHKEDTEEDFAPCLPPERIAMGYIDAGQVVHEQLVKCVNFCDPRPQGKIFYTDLWGRTTRLNRVNVFLRQDGMLELKMLFNEVGQSETRAKHLSLKGPRESLPAGEAGSCSASDQ